jgi:pantoate--beta-alanine ligase
VNTPRLITTIAELRTALAGGRGEGRRIGLVPTMGALHEGHLSLVRTAKRQCQMVVVSIYVNPAQFGPREDLAAYPRTLEADMEKLAGCGGDLVFAPTDAEMYPPGFGTWVEVGTAAEPLEGQCRPGHFRGVAAVVLKLFNTVQPDVAYFGQKDYQQALVIRRLVRDLNVAVEICTCPTVREPDGLAMSSRNAYLSPTARRQAVVLYRCLKLAEQLVDDGCRDAAEICRRLRDKIRSAGPAEIDYIALADPETLEPSAQITGRTLLALAVRIDGTRLIDNCILEGD